VRHMRSDACVGICGKYVRWFDVARWLAVAMCITVIRIQVRGIVAGKETLGNADGHPHTLLFKKHLSLFARYDSPHLNTYHRDTHRYG
jgi:hypothetical protein